EAIPVTIEQGGFDTQSSSFGNTQFEQPNLRLRSLGARLEPTWVVAPRLRLFGIVGISWLRFVAEAPTSTGEFNDLRTAERSGVELDYSFGVGASFELIPDWLNVGASVTYGVAADRTGSAHQEVQAFENGKLYHMGGLPKFDGATDLLFHVGLIL